MIKLLNKIIIRFQLAIAKTKYRLGIFQYFLVFYEGRVKEGWVKGDIHYIVDSFSKLTLIKKIREVWLEKGYEMSDIFILGIYKFKNRLEYHLYIHGLGKNDIPENKNKKSKKKKN